MSTTLLSMLAAFLAQGPAPSPAAAPPLESLSWLAGTWQGRDARGLEMEETWRPLKGGTRLGLHRDVAGGRTVSFEFIRIAAEKDGAIVYWASPGGRPNYLVEADRKEAIKRAVLMAEANDVVLVAGKGHESCQEIGGRRFPFNDSEVIEESIRQT